MTSYGPEQARTGAQNPRAGLSTWDGSSREAGRSTYPRSPSGSGLPRLVDLAGQGFFFLMQFAGAVLWFGGVIAVAYLVAALNNVEQPTERCFKNNLTGETYCREQLQWGDE